MSDAVHSHAVEIPPAGGLRRLGREAGLFLQVVFLVAALGLLLSGPSAQAVRTLSLVFSSIVLEAIPFMLIGALVGGLVEAFVSRERMTALLPRRGWVTVLLAAGMGLVFPVCECAVVPVVRRLARKGLPVSAAVAYLLGGPIVNPIVAASTALAYKFAWSVVLLRLGCGYGIAVFVGLMMGWLSRKEPVFCADLETAVVAPCACGHDHAEHEHHQHHQHAAHHAAASEGPAADAAGEASACGYGHAASQAGDPVRRRLLAAVRHAADDFLAVGHFLVIGAFIAALAQTFIDRKVFLGMTSVPFLPPLLMMALAILLNLCSEADAFVAASFRGLMPLPAQMAFLLTGPMFDLKLLLMYQGLFRRPAIAALAGLILASVLAVVFGLTLIGGIPG